MSCFMIILQVLSGNQNFHTVVSNKLRQPITARYIRFKPLLWNYLAIGMRTEIYGCLGIVKILFYSGHVVGNLYPLWERWGASNKFEA